MRLRAADPLRRALALQQPQRGIHLPSVGVASELPRAEERDGVDGSGGHRRLGLRARTAPATAVRNIPAAASPAKAQLSRPLAVGTTGSGGRL